MPLIRQGAPEGMIETTMGYRSARSPLCTKCRERKSGLYTINVNGQIVCADCSGRVGDGVLSIPEAVLPEPVSVANEAVSDGDLEPN